MKLEIGTDVSVVFMPDRGGEIEKLSMEPGELIARIDDAWYLASELIPAKKGRNDV